MGICCGHNHNPPDKDRDLKFVRRDEFDKEVERVIGKTAKKYLNGSQKVISVNLAVEHQHNYMPRGGQGMAADRGHTEHQPPANPELFKTLAENSPVFTGHPGRLAYPLSFLSSRLSQFTKATRIFTTRDYTHTNVAAEFHQACDNIPNTLVIIKSGQYIAGGYTEVAWETPTQGSVIGAQLSERRYKDSRKAVVFSVNKRKAYRSLQRGGEIGCDKSTGPIFCDGRHDAILVAGNFSLSENRSRIEGDKFDAVGIITGKKELFGNEYFTIDEYEVYKLE